ncbi:DUF6415 family natural product biosynthesis protein [Streptomyces sp. NPDC056716]|uniref:DUF6415 family natural product biosynthesis protein n=1 Tax=unclassified Streptomyces TaxID=2593676 RepID=UPI00367584A1
MEYAITSGARQADDEVAALVQRGRTLRSTELPGGHLQAVAHVRQMAWTLEWLLELLTRRQCLREATEC